MSMHVSGRCKKLSLILGVGVFGLQADPNSPVETAWVKRCSSERIEQVNSIVPSAGGGYLFTGCKESDAAGRNDCIAVKLNDDGTVAWQRSYASADRSAVGYSVKECVSGAYVITGFYTSTADPEPGDDVFTMKISAEGVTEWLKTENGPADERAYSIETAVDGGILVAGWTKSVGAGDADAMVIKYDANGVKQWARTFGSASWDAVYNVTKDNDGGYLLVGDTRSGESALETDIFVIKIDADGNEVWRRIYNSEADESGYSIVPCSDGGYVIAGRSISDTGYGEDDGILIRTDANGAKCWTKRYGGACSDVIYSVKEDGDNGYLLSGCTGSFGTSNMNVYLLKVDSLGDMQWSETTPGAVNVSSAFQKTADNGFILAMNTPDNRGDIQVVKLIFAEQPDSAYATGIYQTFTCAESLDAIGFGGFKKTYWKLNEFDGCMQSNAPGNGTLSKILSPVFAMHRDSGYVKVRLNAGFPTNDGFNWKDHNLFKVGLCDRDGKELYSLVFKPLRSCDIGKNVVDIRLLKDRFTPLGTARTDRITSHGPGSPSVTFEMTLYKEGSIRIQYDAADGLGLLNYIDLPDNSHRMIERLKFMYKTGSKGDGANYMTVDNINVTEHKQCP